MTTLGLVLLGYFAIGLGLATAFCRRVDSPGGVESAAVLFLLSLIWPALLVFFVAVQVGIAIGRWTERRRRGR